MGKFRSYIEETTTELVQKVSWPTWQELQGSAIVVMIASLIIALIVFVIDWFFSFGMEWLYKMVNNL